MSHQSRSYAVELHLFPLKLIIMVQTPGGLLRCQTTEEALRLSAATPAVSREIASADTSHIYSAPVLFIIKTNTMITDATAFFFF